MKRFNKEAQFMRVNRPQKSEQNSFNFRREAIQFHLCTTEVMGVIFVAFLDQRLLK